MRKPKLKKYPKKPKASASLAVMQKYLDRRKDVDKANAAAQSDYKKALDLRKKIAKL
jgi:hypothetical protein